jgi:hypothetical protein
MENELKDKSNFLENIEDLHRLHLVTKEFKHIIEYEPGSWKMFEPSKFVYAYFAFNTLYTIDWDQSCQKNHLSDLKKIKINDKEETATEEMKFNKLIDFVFNNIAEEDIKEFIRFILKPYKKENPKQKKEIIESINEVKSDKNISQNKCNEFKIGFAKLIENEQLEKETINMIIKFIYLVRCNIFHGTKTTIEMANKQQRERLEIYSDILIGINGLLFKSLERVLKTQFEKKYNFKFK